MRVSCPIGVLLLLVWETACTTTELDISNIKENLEISCDSVFSTNVIVRGLGCEESHKLNRLVGGLVSVCCSKGFQACDRNFA